MVIGLNPSTADDINNDPTVRRCIGFARKWEHGGLIMTNIFSLRATDPRVMRRHPRPNGHGNDRWLSILARESGMVLAAWGNHGGHMNRDLEVMNILDGYAAGKVYCLDITKKGFPKHPLYVRGDTRPILYAGRV